MARLIFMSWYKVTKTIRGRMYLYLQRTERHGNKIKTFNKYIGPRRASSTHVSPSQPNEGVTSSLNAPAPSPAKTDQPDGAARARDIMKAFDPHHGLDKHFKRILDKNAEMQRREDERIQYGSRAARFRKEQASIRKAKRESKGVGAQNAFLARAIKRSRGDP